MKPTKLDFIINSASCSAAFQLSDAGLTPLKPSTPKLADAAGRTRDLWASLDALVPDSGIMIAKRDDGQSVASRKGGLIIEATGAINIGIMRAAMQNEDAVKPNLADGLSEDQQPGPKALWNLARWIEQIEANRVLVVTAGDTELKLWARKGRFGTETGVMASDVASAVLEAGSAKKPISLAYDMWTEDAPELVCDPVDLFSRVPSDAAEWVMDNTGCPRTSPKNATLEDAAQAAALAERLLLWGEGRPSEVAILREGGAKEIVARCDASSHIFIKTLGLAQNHSLN